MSFLIQKVKHFLLFLQILISYHFFKYLNMATGLSLLLLCFHLPRDATLLRCFARKRAKKKFLELQHGMTIGLKDR